MTQTYTGFMIFELEDTGERQQLDMSEQDFCRKNGDGVLYPYQVIIIVKEDLRRIYIWKGYASSVRKKFIASRVASELQQELMKYAGFHRCKVISIDQGEEPDDFLNAFGFDNKKIQETTESKQFKFNNYATPLIDKSEIKLKSQEISQEKAAIKPIRNPNTFNSKSFKQLKSEKQSRDILEKILQKNVPENFKRKNILTGTSVLYGEIIKKANIFGEAIEEREWEPIINFPKDIFEIDGHKLRIYFNNELGIIEAIEILESLKDVSKSKKNDKEKGKIDYNKWTVKQLKAFCKENNVSIPSSYRKVDIVRLIKEFTEFEN